MPSARPQGGRIVIPVLAVAVAAFLAGGYLSGSIYGTHRYDTGYAAGAKAQKEAHQLALKALQDQARADALALQLEATRKANEQHTATQQAIENGRVAFARATARADADAVRLAQRLRDAERAAAFAHTADRGGGLPGPPADAGRVEADRRAAAGLVQPGTGERLVQLVKRADATAAALALCRSSWPTPTQVSMQ